MRRTVLVLAITAAMLGMSGPTKATPFLSNLSFSGPAADLLRDAPRAAPGSQVLFGDFFRSIIAKLRGRAGGGGNGGGKTPAC